MKIGYLAQVFPYLSMTFVYREVMALRVKGVEVHTFSTWRPKVEKLSAEAKALVDDTFYIFPFNWPRFLWTQLRMFWSRPLRYLGTLLFCVSREHGSWRNRLRTLYHFAEAVPLAAEVERRGLAHLHVHFALNATTMALIVSRLTNATYSFTAHANDIFCNPILLKEKVEGARFIVVISEYNAHFLQHVVDTEETRRKIHLVRCGIDVARFSPAATPPQNGKPVILGVGRLVEKKGFRYLIDACKILVERGFDFRCLIIGDGPEAEALRAQVEALNLAETVELPGVFFQEEILTYLAQSDIMALPCVVAADQDMDGIPNSLMEGMAMEIPAVSTTVSGVPELITDNESGLLVPPQDADALADALARLLQDEALRRRLGKAGRAKVEADYEIGKNTEQLLGVFRRYLDRQPTEAAATHFAAVKFMSAASRSSPVD